MAGRMELTVATASIEYVLTTITIAATMKPATIRAIKITMSLLVMTTARTPTDKTVPLATRWDLPTALMTDAMIAMPAARRSMVRDTAIPIVVTNRATAARKRTNSNTAPHTNRLISRVTAETTVVTT